MPRPVRGSLGALLLLVLTPAVRANPPPSAPAEAIAAGKRIRDVFDILVFYARPPVDVRLDYRHDLEAVAYDCARGESVPGSQPLAYFPCFDQGLENAVVAGGRMLWTIATNDDELAYIVAHELGHVKLEFGDKVTAYGVSLCGLPPDTRYASRAAKSCLGRLKDDPALHAEFDAFVSSEEAKADDYARGLMKKAGYDPLKGSRAFLNIGDVAVVYGQWGVYMDQTHDPFYLRFERAFDASFEELQRKGP